MTVNLSAKRAQKSASGTSKSKPSCNSTKSSKPKKEAKLSRTLIPDNLSPFEWQRGLRRQFGQAQSFLVENLGEEPIFSDFRVSNLQAKSQYRVTIRGAQVGDNECNCLDFKTNELGTCKHVEFVLTALLSKRGSKMAFTRGFQPAYSELHLRNDGSRAVHFRAGSACPKPVLAAAKTLFDASKNQRMHESSYIRLAQFCELVAQCGHELRVADNVCR